MLWALGTGSLILGSYVSFGTLDAMPSVHHRDMNMSCGRKAGFFWDIRILVPWELKSCGESPGTRCMHLHILQPRSHPTRTSGACKAFLLETGLVCEPTQSSRESCCFCVSKQRLVGILGLLAETRSWRGQTKPYQRKITGWLQWSKPFASRKSIFFMQQFILTYQ